MFVTGGASHTDDLTCSHTCVESHRNNVSETLRDRGFRVSTRCYVPLRSNSSALSQGGDCGGTLMQRRLREVGLAAAILGLLAGMSTVMAVPSTGLMIAEVYGGGGNSGATLTQDFIELGNAGSVAADVTGWSVQYLPASPSSTSQWQVTPLSLSSAVP